MVYFSLLSLICCLVALNRFQVCKVLITIHKEIPSIHDRLEVRWSNSQARFLISCIGISNHRAEQEKEAKPMKRIIRLVESKVREGRR